MENLPILFDSEKMNQLVKACQYFSNSQLVPYSLRGKPQDIAVIMVMAHELNVPQMQALMQISVIQGKPCVSPQMMTALVRSKLPGAVIKIKELKDDHGEPVCRCTVARSKEDDENGLSFTSEWGMNKARALGLAGKDNYKKQAETMLRWRAIGEACRTMFADIVLGVYVESEMQDFDGNELKEVRNYNEELEEEFPIPEEEKEIGPKYRFQVGKFRNKQVFEIPLEEMEKEAQRLEKVMGGKQEKPWHNSFHATLSEIIADYDDIMNYYSENGETSEN